MDSSTKIGRRRRRRPGGKTNVHPAIMANLKKARECMAAKRIAVLEYTALPVSKLNQRKSDVLKVTRASTKSTTETRTYCVGCASHCNSSVLNGDTDNDDIVKTEPMSEGEYFDSTARNCSFHKPQNAALLESQEQRLKEKKLLHQFCTLMGVKLTGIEWNTEGENSECPPFPCPLFCQICRKQLGLLEDLQNKLKDLERDLKQRTNEFQLKCHNSEAKFQQEQVYKKDNFYFGIRSQINGNWLSPVSNKDSASNRTTRKNSRNSTITAEAPPPSEDKPELIIKLESEDAQINNDDNFEDNSVAFDYNDEDCMTSCSAKEDEDYEPPVKKSFVKIPQTKGVKKNKSRLSFRKKPKNGNKRMKKPAPGSSLTAAPTSSRKSTRADTDDSDYFPSEDDGDDNKTDNAEIKITSLKGRMDTDPSTGHVMFLGVAFKILDNGRHQCLTCDTNTDATYNRGCLKRHVVTVHTDMFVCPECGQHCPSAKHLTSHIRRLHRGEDRITVECPICGKPCSSKNNRLNTHMVTHMSSQEREEAIARGEKVPLWSVINKRTCVCDLCGKSYTARSHLTQHKIREHPSDDYTEDEKMASKEMCPDCGKLIHKSYIKKHKELMHSEVITKRFCCSLCNKRFITGSHLRQHKKVVHDDNKPFKCTICPKQFAFKNRLNYHMDNHNNVRPFECDHCEMAFTRKYHLERHIATYHEPGGNPKRKSYVRGPDLIKADVDKKVPGKAQLRWSKEYEGATMGNVGVDNESPCSVNQFHSHNHLQI